MPEEQALFSHAGERVILGKEPCSSTRKTTTTRSFSDISRWDHVENR